jgi:hypothetical protein
MTYLEVLTVSPTAASVTNCYYERHTNPDRVTNSAKVSKCCCEIFRSCDIVANCSKCLLDMKYLAAVTVSQLLQVSLIASNVSNYCYEISGRP